MKLLNIDWNYYEFPDGIKTIEEFIAFVNDNPHKFIELTEFSEKNCVYPYFIREETETVYLNVANIDRISEFDGKVLLRVEYERKLRELVKKKCMDCVYFEGDPDNLDGHYDCMRLDGHCGRYKKKEEDE